MRYINLIIFILLSVFFSNHVFSEEKIITELRKGGKIIFIRHALAPGNGDPDNFSLLDCNTQRNLNYKGILQSKNIGYFFEKNDIPVDIVLSSEWCRCKDTAKFAFGKYETFKALNSFYDEKFFKFKKKQIADLKNYISNWNSDKNLVLVTHYVVISEMLNIGVSSGELAISKKNFDVIGTIESM
tara:strand:+ start:266 stop:820 length:555 start_codon:yes stop_codon:yes gene_type:complete